jgi:hypothetical protein
MTETSENLYWRKCTTCKKTISFNLKYWICSVSTCNRQRTGLVFCTVTCFDAHIPVLNHRDAGAFEKRSPTQAQFQAEKTQEKQNEAGPASPQPYAGETLVVVSKVKEYIRSKSGGMNTSESTMERLTEWITRWCDASVQNAEKNGRKTVLDRDVPTQTTGVSGATSKPPQVILRR